MTRPGRAVNGIWARRRTWRVPRVPVRRRQAQAVTADGMAGPRKASRRVLPVPDGQSGDRGRWPPQSPRKTGLAATSRRARACIKAPDDAFLDHPRRPACNAVTKGQAAARPPFRASCHGT